MGFPNVQVTVRMYPLVLRSQAEDGATLHNDGILIQMELLLLMWLQYICFLFVM